VISWFQGFAFKLVNLNRYIEGEFLVAAEARLKRVRALETSGWRKDSAAFAEVGLVNVCT
jgi:hypothetical protein